MKNVLYTTLTVFDFNDDEHINQLIDLNIGLELALLTTDLDSLKKELDDFKCYFKKFNIPVNMVRIHEPVVDNFALLKTFFEYCYELGFQHFTIHPPYEIDPKLDIKKYQEQVRTLIPHAHLEVEEVNVNVHGERRFEQLMQGQKATVILDVYECGGVERTIERLKDLKSKGFDIKSIHLQKDKHKFLTSDEVGLLKKHFSGNFINEGFVKSERSFDEFVKTKSVECIVTHIQKVDILKSYKNKIGI